MMANLTYIPASALGRFKYIFSEKLRKKYFERIDRKTIEIKEDNKYSHGQVSKEEANEILKHQEHMRVIDILWAFNQRRRESQSPRCDSPVFRNAGNKHQLPLELLQRKDFVATLLDVFRAEDLLRQKEKELADQQHRDFMARIREQIKEQELIAAAEAKIIGSKKKSRRYHPSVEQIVKKAMRPVEKIDKAIRFQSEADEELLGFYKDKFSVSKRDLNPFVGSYLPDGTSIQGRMTMKEKNLSRRVVTNRHSLKRLERMNEKIRES